MAVCHTRRLLNLNIQKKLVLIADYDYRLTELNYKKHCVKNVQIWGFFWSVFSYILTAYGDLRSYLDTFHVVKYQPTFVILIAHGAPGNPEIDMTLMFITKTYRDPTFTES